MGEYSPVEAEDLGKRHRQGPARRHRPLEPRRRPRRCMSLAGSCIDRGPSNSRSVAQTQYPPLPHPRGAKDRIQSIDNLNMVFAMLKSEGLRVVNISAEDIADGNVKLILGLLWYCSLPPLSLQVQRRRSPVPPQGPSSRSLPSASWCRGSRARTKTSRRRRQPSSRRRCSPSSRSTSSAALAFESRR